MFKAIKYGTSWLLDGLRDILNIRYQKPIKNINFPITDNCNSKCVMCNVWVEKSSNEFTADEIGRIFCHPSLSSVEHVGISGGEPSLRSDLVECVSNMLAGSGNLKSLSITSHGYHFNRWSRFLPRIIKLCASANTRFTLNLSMDGVGGEHDKVRGISGAFGRLEKTIELATRQGVSVQLQCTITKLNVYSVVGVLVFAIDKNIDVIFRLATEIERLSNKNITDNYQLDLDQKSYLADFFSSDLLRNNTKSLARKLYYKEIALWLIAGGQRRFPCYFQKEGVLINAKGDVYNCSVSGAKLGNIIASDRGNSEFLSSVDTLEARERVIRDICPSCIHDQSGAWSPLLLVREVIFESRSSRKIASLAGKLIRAIKYFFQILMSRVTYARQVQSEHFVKGSRACIIGAYGGEHVGDAAILGGVILRLIERHSLDEAVVLSIRPDRTERWVRTLNLPVPVKVICYEDDALVQSVLRQSKMLVYGGGPLMELPLHLLKHLRTVAWARNKFRLPFYIEGVGVGPLKTPLSMMIVRRIFLGACESVVRTNAAKESLSYLKIANEDVSVDRDPAFDYLDFKPDKVLPLKARERQFLETITSASGTVRIGINLRSLWGKYSSDSSIDLAVVERNLLEAVVNSVSALNREGFQCEVFYFSMNSDLYGFSDFIPGNRLRALMEAAGQPVTIWHEESGIDGMVQFLEKMSVVISMRFHGCIFALSQNHSNVIGIDYQIGSKGKVSELFVDRSLERQVIHVQDCSSEKMTRMIKDVLGDNYVRVDRILSKSL